MIVSRTARNMTGLEIRDRTPAGVLAFDLRDILTAIGPRIRALTWSCSDLECVGEAAEELHRVADEGTQVDGVMLENLAGSISQVIDGRFTGRVRSDAPPEIVIQAVDSTLWEVFGDPDALSGIQRRFSDVKPASYDAG
jgi:hypothetical protein